MFKSNKGRMMLSGLLLWMLAASLMTESTCIYRATLGLPCPGCGMTRALRYALLGNIKGAFDMHPLWPLIPITVVIGAGVIVSGQKIRLKTWLRGKKGNVLWLALLTVVIGVYLLRMFLLFPHSEPLTFNERALLPQLYNFFIIR